MSTNSSKAKELLSNRMKRLSLEITPEAHMGLKMMAVQQQVPIRDLVMEAYEQYLKPKYQEVK